MREGKTSLILKYSLTHLDKIMKKISGMETVLLVLFIVWVVNLDMNSLTTIQKVGLGAASLYTILLVVKVVK